MCTWVENIINKFKNLKCTRIHMVKIENSYICSQLVKLEKRWQGGKSNSNPE